MATITLTVQTDDLVNPVTYGPVFDIDVIATLRTALPSYAEKQEQEPVTDPYASFEFKAPEKARMRLHSAAVARRILTALN